MKSHVLGTKECSNKVCSLWPCFYYCVQSIQYTHYTITAPFHRHYKKNIFVCTSRILKICYFEISLKTSSYVLKAFSQ